ncbi:MAG: ATP-binding protein, partial [Sphaerochaetaceae bacterium]|nr:ATP-binding protein [Sphaerochaetaceae bacterium]
MVYIKRFLEEQVLKASKQYPVVMVCGQRQVGKSTMLHHIMESNRKYVTLDDFNALRLAQTDPSLFFDTYGDCLLIDEFQRAPNLLLEIKRRVDKTSLNGKDNSGMYWLTGSQKFPMMKNVSESLAGRITVFEMTGLSNAELEGRLQDKIDFSITSLKARLLTAKIKNVSEIYRIIFQGSFPKLLTSDIERERYYMDYVNTYLERDIKTLEQVGKLTEFHNFLIYMAAHTAQELKYEEISNAIGVSCPTVKQWVSILQRSGIIYTLHPFFSNITNRLVKTPKVYFMDTG